MIFGVHNHYNNNANNIGDFNDPSGFPCFGEAEVRLTGQGLVIFNLGKRLSLEEKLRLAEVLDEKLRGEFGKGISFATCASSDCVAQYELTPYYEGIKSLNPDIVTIYAASKIFDRWIGCPENLVVDHRIDNSGDSRETALKVVAALAPSEADMVTPAQGWRVFLDQLDHLYETAVDSINPPRAASKITQRFQP